MSRKKLDIPQNILISLPPINRRIYDVLEFTGESNTVFTSKIGISKSFLKNILWGETKPSIETLFGISQNYAIINLRWLLTGEGQMLGGEEKGGDLELRESQKKYILKDAPAWVKKVAEILESDSDYSRALDANINAFYRSFSLEKDLQVMKKRINCLEAEVAALKGLMKGQNEIPSMETTVGRRL